MIIGDGFLADGARQAFGNVPFDWVLDHPTLQPLDGRLSRADVIVISTPIRVGTIAHLEELYPARRFAYIPENVRQAHPEDWKTQARYVIGTRSMTTVMYLEEWFTPPMWMSPESAEMVKHALNGFLALSIGYTHRIARLSALYGADPYEVAKGVMSDPRIGLGAYLAPDGDIGPNLQREVDTLNELDR